MSNSLINNKFTDPLAILTWAEARKSWAYYSKSPYPFYNFGIGKWYPDTPLPPAPDYTQIIVDKSAEMVFRGGGPAFSVPDNQLADEFLQAVIKQSRLDSRWISLQRNLGNVGTIAAKFNLTPDTSTGVHVSFLNVPNECRIILDPHNHTSMLFARIQYPYRDISTGDWFYFREEYTQDEIVHYKPLRAGGANIVNAMTLPDYAQTLGDNDAWEIDSVEKNENKCIPIVIIRNKPVEGSTYGFGDCWGSWAEQDDMAKTLHFMDRFNQNSSDPRVVFENAELQNTGRLQPGEPISVMSADNEKDARARLLDPIAAGRQWVKDFYTTREALLYKSCGVANINEEAITNSGQMTIAALRFLYEDSTATADQKRIAWGIDGMCQLFEKLLTAVGINKYNPDTQEVAVQWSDYFTEPAQDLLALTQRTLQQVQAKALTLPRAAERLALAEGVSKTVVPDIVREAEGAALEIANTFKAQGQASTDDDVIDNNIAQGEIVDASPNTNV